jgi:hypothetical protein
VCCIYAIKEAVIAKEHSAGPLDAAIFFIDMRIHGKEFEKYYWRAEEEFGIRFVRSRVHSIDPVPGTDDVSIRYLDEDGTLNVETFDLLVLSTGMEVSPSAMKLSRGLGVTPNPDRFAETSSFAPVSTKKPGIYVCGALRGLLRMARGFQPLHQVLRLPGCLPHVLLQGMLPGAFGFNEHREGAAGQYLSTGPGHTHGQPLHRLRPVRRELPRGNPFAGALQEGQPAG